MVTGILENSHTTVESSDVMVGVEDMFALRQVASAVKGLEGTKLCCQSKGGLPKPAGTLSPGVTSFLHVPFPPLLSTSEVITKELREELVNMGFSRVPVYEGSKANILGFFHVRESDGAGLALLVSG